MKVYDLIGREIAAKEVFLEEGSFSMSFADNNLKQGMYLITGVSGSSRYTKTIIVK